MVPLEKGIGFCICGINAKLSLHDMIIIVFKSENEICYT